MARTNNGKTPVLSDRQHRALALALEGKASAEQLAYHWRGAGDRIVLVALRDGRQIHLADGTRSGCWLDASRFVAATDKEMRLYAPPAASAGLMRGQWLPRRRLDGKDGLIACSRGRHRGEFQMVRVMVTAAE